MRCMCYKSRTPVRCRRSADRLDYSHDKAIVMGAPVHVDRPVSVSEEVEYFRGLHRRQHCCTAANCNLGVGSDVQPFNVSVGERNCLSGNRTTFPQEAYTTCSKFSAGGWVKISFQLTTFVRSVCYAIPGELGNQNRIR